MRTEKVTERTEGLAMSQPLDVKMRARGILHAYTQIVECGQWWCSAMVVGSNLCHFRG
jgi:hypothetical protein